MVLYAPATAELLGNVCEERGGSSVLDGLCTCSSPRVRGTRWWCRRPGPYRRFIPASAGNALNGIDIFLHYSVHPRECGEHAFADQHRRWVPGSSPRVRGTHTCHVADRRQLRFIPASAGNTIARRSFGRGPSVHPRECGEHWRPCGYVAPVIGSSPRVQGTPRPNWPNRLFWRFIPASAGNT